MNKKCRQCGMINFESAPNCKRCNLDLSQAISSEQAKAAIGKMFCKDCGAVTVPVKGEKWDDKDSVEKYLVTAWVIFFLLTLLFGSFLITLFCILFGVAGAIYRLTVGSAVAGCSVCGAKKALIPAESPMAQQFLGKSQ